MNIKFDTETYLVALKKGMQTPKPDSGYFYEIALLGVAVLLLMVFKVVGLW